MTSGTNTSWQIDGETVETVKDFTLGDSKITTDGDCSHEIKRRLLLERKAMTNLDCREPRQALLTKWYMAPTPSLHLAGMVLG